jgi:hypothetical protein
MVEKMVEAVSIQARDRRKITPALKTTIHH